MRIATWDHGYLSGSHLEGEVLHAKPGWSTDFSMEFLYRNKTIWLGNSIENSLGNSISVLYMDLYTISGESAENQHRTDRT